MSELFLVKSARLEEWASIAHGFTTREGGVSSGALASLNLGLRPAEIPENLRENWTRVAAALGVKKPEDVAVLSQVHGDRVVEVREACGPLEVVAEADGAVCTVPGIILGVRVADCVPVLIAAHSGVAVAHAGWRGVAKNVVSRTVCALANASGVEARDMMAVVGPHISAAVYEIGVEVVEAFREAGIPDGVFLREREQRRFADLGAAVAFQLRESGVRQVHSVEICTATDSRFYSHRRDGAETGRFAGVIALRRPS